MTGVFTGLIIDHKQKHKLTSIRLWIETCIIGSTAPKMSSVCKIHIFQCLLSFHTLTAQMCVDKVFSFSSVQDLILNASPLHVTSK